MTVKADEKGATLKGHKITSSVGYLLSQGSWWDIQVHFQQQLDICQDIGVEVKVDKDILKLLT